VRRSTRPRRVTRSMVSILLPDLGNWILPVMLADGSQIRRLDPPWSGLFFSCPSTTHPRPRPVLMGCSGSSSIP
jgi:hypothetical protein